MNFDLSTYLSNDEMIDVVGNGKKSQTIRAIKNTLGRDAYRKALNTIHNKVPFEYSPAIEINKNKQWLTEVFGFPGQLMITWEPNGTDAVYVSDDGAVCKSIELKYMGVLPIEEENRTSPYFDGTTYWDVEKKAWKFRDESHNFKDDCAIVMIGNTEDDSLVEAIYISEAQIKATLDKYISPSFHLKGNNPIGVRYTGVKDCSHMRGNHAPIDFNQILVDAAVLSGFIDPKVTKGSCYYSKYQASWDRFSIGKTKAEAAAWLIEQAKSNQEIADFVAALQED